MYKPTNSADYPSAQTSVNCTELLAVLQDDPQIFIATLDNAMSRILPCVLASGVQLTREDVNEYNSLRSLRNALINSVSNPLNQ